MTGTAEAGSWAKQQDDAVRLHRLMTGYLASKVLFSAMELRAFDALDKGLAPLRISASRSDSRRDPPGQCFLLCLAMSSSARKVTFTATSQSQPLSW